jgi:hypothetical protein
MACSPYQDFKFDAVPSRRNIVARRRQQCKAQMRTGVIWGAVIPVPPWREESTRRQSRYRSVEIRLA